MDILVIILLVMAIVTIVVAVASWRFSARAEEILDKAEARLAAANELLDEARRLLGVN